MVKIISRRFDEKFCEMLVSDDKEVVYSEEYGGVITNEVIQDAIKMLFEILSKVCTMKSYVVDI